MKRRTPRGGLTEEERALWRRVVDTVRPLAAAPPDGQRTARPTIEDPPVAEPQRTGARPRPAPALDAAAVAPRSTVVLRPAGRAEPPARWAPPAADRPGPVLPATPGLDRGTARRLGRGRIAPQARLDLHGMTADRAHAALAQFMAASAAGGLRCVLVVTGKGGGPGARGEGVLRRETPRWLTAPPLAGMVVGVFEAHARHGGAGALYVYLRRRR